MKKTLFVLPLLFATNAFATTLECEYKGSKIEILINEDMGQIKVNANTSIDFNIESANPYEANGGKAISFRVTDGKDARGLTYSGEIAIFHGKNGEQRAGMRLRNNESAKTVISTGEMNCK